MIHQKYLPIGLLMSSLTFACSSESKIISAQSNQDGLFTIFTTGEVYSGDFQREVKENQEEVKGINEKSLDTAPKLVPECPLPYFKDQDKDNYGNPQFWVCEPLSGFVKDNSDCDDNNFYILPKAKEICNGLDDNCDGVIDDVPDENLTVYYHDQDGDGFGDQNASGKYCSAPEGFVDNSSDCDDSNNKVSPKAMEICNGIDDNCQNGIDENLTQLCSRACGSGTEYCVNGTWQNCDAPPLQPEVCDGLDNNCNGEIDEGLTLEQKCGETNIGACSFGVEYSYCKGKKYTGWMNCTAVFPAAEICDGEDNDCDGETDESVKCKI